MFDMKMPPKKSSPESSSSPVEEELMEDPGFEEEPSEGNTALQTASDEELLAEFKKRGLSSDILKSEEAMPPL